MVETERYRKDFNFKQKEKFKFIMLGEGNPIESENKPVERYFFSGGKSNREFLSLIEAFGQIDEKLIICTDQQSIQNKGNLSLIEIYFNKPREDFYRYIENSFAVIITVEDPEISSGQLVLLHALRYGKPVIVTEGPCMQDYILDNYAYFIKHRDVHSLKNIIKELAINQRQYSEMSKKARESYLKYFSIDKYLERIAKEAVSIELQTTLINSARL
ncbi:MAG TPA: glycosyltransferase [Bacteroidales bacterium]|nr:glycosyltransferase [Bacteroidales bacterium]